MLRVCGLVSVGDGIDSEVGKGCRHWLCDENDVSDAWMALQVQGERTLDVCFSIPRPQRCIKKNSNSFLSQYDSLTTEF